MSILANVPSLRKKGQLRRPLHMIKLRKRAGSRRVHPGEER
jgi:hypothetical protein